MKDKYVWILNIGLPQPFATKKIAELHLSTCLNKGYIGKGHYPIYKKKIITK